MLAVARDEKKYSRNESVESNMRPLITKLSLFAFSLIATLLVLELLFRMLMPGWAPMQADRSFWVYDDLLGWSHKANEKGTYNHPDFSVSVSNNPDGQRDLEYTVERIQGKNRMLVLGDSMGWGFGVELEERFSEILESKYPDWEVINASVSGYGTDQELLYYKHRGSKYQPDVVLVLFHPNDVRNVNRSTMYWHNKPKFELVNGALQLTGHPVPKPSIKQRLDRFFLGNTYFLSRLYRPLKSTYWSFKRLLRGNKGGGDSNVAHPHALTGALFQELQKATKENGSHLVVVSCPGEEEQGGEEAIQYLTDVLSTAGIPYLSLDQAFEGKGKATRFEHDRHWNVAGHRLAAEAIDSFLTEAGILSN